MGELVQTRNLTAIAQVYRKSARSSFFSTKNFCSTNRKWVRRLSKIRNFCSSSGRWENSGGMTPCKWLWKSSRTRAVRLEPKGKRDPISLCCRHQHPLLSVIAPFGSNFIVLLNNTRAALSLSKDWCIFYLLLW